MERTPGVRYLPLLVIAVVALIVALAGTAFGGSDAISAISSKTVKKIATKQINQLAPGLSVAKAKSADSATSADNAGHAATSDKVDGADVCSDTLALQNNDVKIVCQAGGLDVEASCGISAGSADVQVTLQSVANSSNDAWAFGETVDGASAVRLAEPFFGGGQANLAEGLDTNNNPGTADGQGAFFSAGDTAGSSLSGDVSARANLTAPSQGECLVTLGVTAR